MTVYKKFAKLFTITAYIGVFYMRVFHYWFVYGNPIAIISECLPMIGIVALLCWIICMAEKNLLISFEKTINTAKKAKRNLTESEEKKCLSLYNRFDKAVAIGVAVGFILGAGSTNILLAVKGVEKFDPLLFILFELHSITIGFLCLTLLIYQIKKGLMANMLRSVGVTSISTDITGSMSLAFVVCICLALINMIMIPIGLLRMPREHSFGIYVAYCVAGVVLTAIVCSVTYSIMVKKLHGVEATVKSRLAKETENLAAAAKESAATSQDQSAAVKEIVVTMEDSNTLSTNITEKIQNVATQAEKSRQDVFSGAAAIEESSKKFQDIMDTNQKTIQGIQDLNNKIDSVFEIVTFINDMADQAKIIAFNAELEASSAGEMGKNFHVVAGEVRRLSDNIIDGTKEIKQKIEEMQDASNNLIELGENGTKKINSGNESVKSLSTMFESIEQSADLTAKSSSDIIDFVKQMSSSSEQIFVTLKQIASSAENFSQASDNISSASENVRNIASEL